MKLPYLLIKPNVQSKTISKSSILKLVILIDHLNSPKIAIEEPN